MKTVTSRARSDAHPDGDVEQGFGGATTRLRGRTTGYAGAASNRVLLNLIDLAGKTLYLQGVRQIALGVVVDFDQANGLAHAGKARRQASRSWYGWLRSRAVVSASCIRRRDRSNSNSCRPQLGGVRQARDAGDRRERRMPARMGLAPGRGMRNCHVDNRRW